MRCGIAIGLVWLLQLGRHLRKHVLRRPVSHENVQVAVIFDEVKGVEVLAVRIEKVKGSPLALRQEAQVARAAKEGESCICLGWRGSKIRGQPRGSGVGNQVAPSDTTAHLREK